MTISFNRGITVAMIDSGDIVGTKSFDEGDVLSDVNVFPVGGGAMEVQMPDGSFLSDIDESDITIEYQ